MRPSLPGPAFFLAGDSYPRCSHIEDALRQRLSFAFAGWTGQDAMLAGAEGGRYDPAIPHRLDLLERFVPKDGGAVLIGRSSGSRVASLFALRSAVAAVICLGYPFHRRKRPLDPDRYLHLARIATPVLIFQGTSDLYGGREVASRFPFSPAVEIEFLDSDHELHLTEMEWDEVARKILDFCARASGAGTAPWADAGFSAAAGPAPR